MKPHRHAEVIKLWADGNVVQCRSNSSNGWRDVTEPSPNWHIHCEYRIKPEPPKYPQTKMTDEECHRTWQQGMGLNSQFGGLRSVANAAIARAIEDGDVITLDEHNAAYARTRESYVPESVLEKVARAVVDAAVKTIRLCNNPRYQPEGFGSPAFQVGMIDVNAIIEAVKQGK